jgi:hypothetical protein
MQPNPAVPSKRNAHQRYRQFLRAGFSPRESAGLVAVSDGRAGHADGQSPAVSTWRWQELSRIEFMGYLARSGRLGGPADGRP